MTLSKLDALKIERVYDVLNTYFVIAPEDEFDLNPVEKDDNKIWAVFGYFYKAVVNGVNVKYYRKYAIHIYFGNWNSVQSFHVNDLGFGFPEEPKGVGKYD